MSSQVVACHQVLACLVKWWHVIVFFLLSFWEAVYLTKIKKLKKYDRSTRLVYHHDTGEATDQNGVVNPVVMAHTGRLPVQDLPTRAEEGSLVLASRRFMRLWSWCTRLWSWCTLLWSR